MTWFVWLLLGWVLLSLPVALVTGRVLRGLQEIQPRFGVRPRGRRVTFPDGLHLAPRSGGLHERTFQQ